MEKFVRTVQHLLSLLELNTREKGVVAAHNSNWESNPLIGQDSATQR